MADDATVEDEPWVEGDQNPHPNVLQNETPNFLIQMFSTVMFTFETYGWYILLALLGLILISPKLKAWFYRTFRTEKENEGIVYDGDTARERQEAMEKARRRLQEQHDAQAALHAEKQRIKEEEKRQQKIQEWENHKQGKGYHSKIKSQDNDTQPSGGPKPKPKTPQYRSTDFSPLMGGGGGGASGYRPPARRGGGG